MERAGVIIDVQSNFDKAANDANRFKQTLGSIVSGGMKFEPFLQAQAERKGAPFADNLFSGNRNVLDSLAANRPSSQDFNGKFLSDKANENLVAVKENTKALVDELKRQNRDREQSEGGNNLPDNVVNQNQNQNGEQQNSEDKLEGIYKTVTGSALIQTAKGLINTGFGIWDGINGVNAARRRTIISTLQGDAWGASRNNIERDVSRERTISSAVGGGIGIVGGIVGMILGGPAGAMIGASLGSGIKMIADGITDRVASEERSRLEFGGAMSSMYQANLPTRERAVSAFYNRSGTDQTFFRNKANGLVDIWEEKARNTGVDIHEFGDYTIDLAKQGVTDATKAANMTRKSALYANFTAGDIGQINSYMGLVGRYGKESGGALDYAYGATRASGLKNTQFGEFLQGLESVISSGISKGFTQSTEEVSNTLVMLSRLSNGSEFWKGEEGAKRLNQINAGIENATSLSSTTQMLTYRAFRDSGLVSRGSVGDGTYIDGQPILNTFALMEKGLNKDNYQKIKSTFQNTFKGDVMSEVMAWKEISGLNYRGAMQLYNMGLNPLSDDFDSKIRSMQENPEYMGDISARQNIINNLQTIVAKMGTKYYDSELQQLQESLEDILTELRRRDEPEEETPAELRTAATDLHSIGITVPMTTYYNGPEVESDFVGYKRLWEQNPETRGLVDVLNPNSDIVQDFLRERKANDPSVQRQLESGSVSVEMVDKMLRTKLYKFIEMKRSHSDESRWTSDDRYEYREGYSGEDSYGSGSYQRATERAMERARSAPAESDRTAMLQVLNVLQDIRTQLETGTLELAPRSSYDVG